MSSFFVSSHPMQKCPYYGHNTGSLTPHLLTLWGALGTEKFYNEEKPDYYSIYYLFCDNNSFYSNMKNKSIRRCENFPNVAVQFS